MEFEEYVKRRSAAEFNYTYGVDEEVSMIIIGLSIVY